MPACHGDSAAKGQPWLTEVDLMKSGRLRPVGRSLPREFIDVTVGEAALFAQWLRDSFVPSPAGVRFLSSFVMENGVETPSALPATGSASEIEAVFRHHLASAGIE